LYEANMNFTGFKPVTAAHDGTAGSDAIDRDLRPAAGGATRIDHPAARPQ